MSGNVQLTIFLLTPHSCMLSQSRTSSNDFCWVETSCWEGSPRANSPGHLWRFQYIRLWQRLAWRVQLWLINYKLCRQCESLLLDILLGQHVCWNHLSCLRAHPTHNIRNRWLLIHLSFCRRLIWIIACDVVDVTFVFCVRFLSYINNCLSKLLIGQWFNLAIIHFD